MKITTKLLTFLLPTAIFAGQQEVLFHVPFDGDAVPAVKAAETRTTPKRSQRRILFPASKAKP